MDQLRERRQNMDSPRVSVIIPAFNAAGTIRQCVSSVLDAEYDGTRQVIVVDDASTDDTCAVVETMNCRLIRTAGNSGPATARNIGAAQADGDILIFVDSDTRMRPDSIRQAVGALKEEGVEAVVGTYEAEPLNRGFFQTYYAYLKYHAFTSASVRTIGAFGAQCGAIKRTLFERIGGFRPFPWGMDIENDEIGYRISQLTTLRLSRDFRVGHHFPGLRKLIYVFTARVFWYVLFRRYHKYGETVLMTDGFGRATAALPAAILLGILAVGVSVKPLSLLLGVGSVSAAACFAIGYSGFWAFCTRRRGLAFGAACVAASAVFAAVITASAAWAYLNIAWLSLRGRNTLFAQPALRRV